MTKGQLARGGSSGQLCARPAAVRWARLTAKTCRNLCEAPGSQAAAASQENCKKLTSKKQFFKRSFGSWHGLEFWKGRSQKMRARPEAHAAFALSPRLSTQKRARSLMPSAQTTAGRQSAPNILLLSALADCLFCQATLFIPFK